MACCSPTSPCPSLPALRPTEIARVGWDRIDLTGGTITLEGKMAKTRQRRIVKLPGNAVAWLLPYAVQRPQLKPSAFQVHFGRVKKAAGFNGKPGTAGRDGEAKLRPWVQSRRRYRPHQRAPRKLSRCAESSRHQNPLRKPPRESSITFFAAIRCIWA